VRNPAEETCCHSDECFFSYTVQPCLPFIVLYQLFFAMFSPDFLDRQPRFVFREANVQL